MANSSSKIYRFGKFIAIEYPEIYFRFVSKLYKEYPEIVEAMVKAEVRIQDGTAMDFLNHLFGTNNTKETPMELGYALWMDKLSERTRSIISNKEALDIAAKNIADTYLGFKREDKDVGKPLFPSLDELDYAKRKGLLN